MIVPVMRILQDVIVIVLPSLCVGSFPVWLRKTEPSREANVIQRSDKIDAPGLEYFAPALAYRFCLNLPAVSRNLEHRQ